MVYAGSSLKSDETGVTIHYAAHAESAAREIARRLRADPELTVRLKELELVSEQDMVVWVGK